ncbi:MAG TPA: SGNH/GDSL hydrolase family protein [Longimicrobiales bacterium]|nr:SGNH/GDSL hydrolase family protein [Longimicrobiales bacterium]
MFFRIVAFVVGSIMALVIAELTLRALHLAPVNGVYTVDAAQYQAIPGIFAPNQRVMDRRRPGLPHEVTIDSLGFRGPPVARAKPVGETRVLFVGDSFTYGDFVNDDETLPAQVVSRLQPVCATRLRVINAGLGGSTIEDQVRLVERALPLAPDLVVLVFSENDVTDLGRKPLWDRLAENREAKSRFPLSILYPVLRRTALWNLGLKVSAVRRQRANGEEPRRPVQAHPRPPEKLQDRYRADLVALRNRLAALRIPFLFAVYPSYFSVNGDSAAAVHQRTSAAWAVKTATSEGIPTTDFLPALRASGLSNEQLYLLPRDGHPSARGYAIAADVFADVLLNAEPVRGSCNDGRVH